jgi:hypothetical protein
MGAGAHPMVHGGSAAQFWLPTSWGGGETGRGGHGHRRELLSGDGEERDSLWQPLHADGSRSEKGTGEGPGHGLSASLYGSVSSTWPR